MPRSAYQVLVDCPTCRIEGAVIELVEADAASGTALESRCRYCGYRTLEGRVLDAGAPPGSGDAVRAALERWAREEGEEPVVFLDANFCGLPATEVETRLLAGERVATSFDVLGYLFPGAGVGGHASMARSITRAPIASATEPTHDTERLLAASNLAARAMAALMLADGEIRPGERRFLDQFLERAGHEALAPDDLRPWRPTDLDLPDDPEPIVEAMLHLMYADRQSDETEWRVVREFARHWGVSLERVEQMHARLDRRHASVVRRLFLILRSLFVLDG